MFQQLLALSSHFALPFIIVMGTVVFVHEFGHYWVARRCGIKIETFSIGFGPEIFGWNDKHGTRWKVSWLPLGGYVKMFGDADAASSPDGKVHAMTPEEKKVSFFHQSVGKRIAVVAAGPAFNYLFAVLVMSLAYMAPPLGISSHPLLCHVEAEATADAAAKKDCFLFQGQHFTPPVVGGLSPIVGEVPPDSPAAKIGVAEGDRLLSINGVHMDQYKGNIESIAPGEDPAVATIVVERRGEQKELKAPMDALDSLNAVLHANVAAKAGMQAGDRIVAIDGHPIDRFEDIRLIVMMNSGTPIQITFERAGETKSLSLTPEVVISTDRFGGKHSIGRLGITSNTTEYHQWPFFQAIQHAAMETLDISTGTLRGIGQIIMGTRSTDELGGTIRIAQIAGKVSEDGPVALVHLMAMISINLGLINLFPIPGLDGGHLFFYFAEHIRGRPLHEKVQEIGMRVGLVLILSLMIFANLNDVIHLGWLNSLKEWLF